jgi:kinesin family protein 5
MLGSSISDPEQRGMIPRMVSHVFDCISSASEEMEFEIKVSMCEIYMEKIRDLIDPTKTDLKVREDKSKGVFIDGITEFSVSEEGEVY